MNADIFLAKLDVDKALGEDFGFEADTAGEYASFLKNEIRLAKKRLSRYEEAYEVYRSLHKMGLESREQIAFATFQAANKLLASGENETAVRLLLDAANQGSNEAKTALGKAYVYGELGLPKKGKEGVALLKEAAGEGNPKACLLLTSIHDDFPRLVPSDVALEMCQNAADMGYEPAAERLKKPFDRSKETKGLLSRYNAGEKGVAFWLSTRGDLTSKERERYFYASVEEGDPLAELEMGYAAERNGDKEGARSYYQKAADHGSGPACFALINLIMGKKKRFWKGPGHPDVDDPLHIECLALVRRAAEVGDNRGLSVLGRSYVRGYMVEKDYEAARPLLERAISQGERDSAPQMLGELYEHSEGPDTATKAAYYYGLAAYSGNYGAMIALSRIYEKGLREVDPDPAKAAYWSLRASDTRW